MSPVANLSALQASEAEFIAKHFGPIVGARLIGTHSALDESEGGLWPTLTFETDAGVRFQMELSQDPEGNGPGWAFIEEVN